MSIYRLCADYKNFLMFVLHTSAIPSETGKDLALRLNPEGPQPQPDWVTPDAVYEWFEQNPDAKDIPDISFWGTSNLILNQKAHDVLLNYLKAYGEFLPVNVKDELFYIFNVLHLVDGSVINLDQSEREFEGEGEYKYQVGLHKLKFNENLLIDTLIFKTEYDTFLNIFCGDNFKTLIEMSGLKGINFKIDLASTF